jgi:hypothetical protein
MQEQSIFIAALEEDDPLGEDIAPDGKHALSGGKDGTMRLWRLAEPAKPAK